MSSTQTPPGRRPPEGGPRRGSRASLRDSPVPARPTAAELRSAWAWARVVPVRSWALLTALWRTERRRTLLVLGAAAGVALVLALLGAGRAEIWDILTTVGLGALVLAVSSDHRTAGAVVVTVLALSLTGTLAGPRWHPQATSASLSVTSSSTAIGGGVTTAPVGTYEVRASEIMVTQADGEEVPALLRQPLDAEGALVTGTPGVVFMHGAGTQSTSGLAGQATALASAGATTIVPSKPMEDYSLTERDYVAMAADYARSLDALDALSTVDSTRLGVYAESEGSYPGVVLAAEDARVSFLVLASAPVVGLREQAAFAAGSYLSDVGVPEVLLNVVARVLGSARIPGGGFEYADFDAAPYERRITVPVLMLYGTADSSMPIVQGPLTLREALASAGNDQLTVRYYEGLNHGLKEGHSTSRALAPQVARDLTRWVLGLPATGGATPHVAGATPVQDFWAAAPSATRWYASGDLMLTAFILGPVLLLLAAAIWLLGQAPRLRGGRGLHLPDPIGRWTGSLAVSVIATWVLYIAYLAAVARLALSYASNPWVSYGGWAVAQLMALVTVVILVKLVQRAWRMRGHVRHGRDDGGRWLTLPAGALLGCAVTGSAVLMLALAYWGLFPSVV